MHQVKTYDGAIVTVTDEVIDHIERKHPEMLLLVGFAKQQLISSVVQTLEKSMRCYVIRRFMENLF